MSLIDAFLTSPQSASLASALAHFLWQGTIVALVAAVALRCLCHHSPSLRYAVASVALLIMLALPLSRVAIDVLSSSAENSIPFAVTSAPEGDPESRQAALSGGSSSQPAGVVQAGHSIKADFEPLLSWLMIAWLLGVTFLSLRLLGGWLSMRRLAGRSNRWLEGEWPDRLSRICRQMQVSRVVGLVDSALVSVPTAIGWLHPIILLPVGTLTGLTPQQLEAIIAHEVAHIRRHDYLVNLLQSVIETLLFYHPAVWWISRQVRLERELCCDDLAAAMCGSPLVYARALLEMEELRAAKPRLAMAANGGSLMNRIKRLASSHQDETARSSGLLTGMIVIAILVSAGAAAQVAIPSHTGTAAATNSLPVRIDSTRPTIGLQPPATGRAGVPLPAEPTIALHEPASLPAGVTPDPPAISSATTPAGQSGDMAKLASSNPSERAEAACSLGKAGAVESITALVNVLADDTSIAPMTCWTSGHWSPAYDTFRHSSPGEQAAIALASFGQASVEPLIAALNLPNPAARSNAAWALGELRGGLSVNRDAAIEPLIAALTDAHPWVRRAAAFSLGEMRPRSAIPPLIGTLDDADEKVREMAAGALGEMKSRSAVGGLSTTLVRDQNRSVRRKAAWSLGEIRDAAALEALTAALNDIDLTVRASVRRAISEIRD